MNVPELPRVYYVNPEIEHLVAANINILRDTDDTPKLFEFVCAYMSGTIPWDMFRKREIFDVMCDHFPVLRGSDEGKKTSISRQAYDALTRLGWRDLGVDACSPDFSIALQMKYYGDNTWVKWEDVAKFYAFADFMLSAKEKWLVTKSANPTFSNCDMPFVLEQNKLKLYHLMNLDAVAKSIQYIPPEVHPFALRKCQQDAIVAVKDYFETDDVAAISMPCGSGKTIVALEIMKWWRENYNDLLADNASGYSSDDLLRSPFGGSSACASSSYCDEISRIAVFVPSLILMDQFAKVCDDYLGIDCRKVCGTSPYQDGHEVYVCTYHSAEKLEGHYGLVVVDESHHMDTYESGRPGLSPLPEDDNVRKMVKHVLTDKVHALSRDRLLYISATPKRSELVYEYSLAQAIEDGVLSDYEVVVPILTVGSPMDLIVNLIHENTQWTHILAYCNSVHSASALCEKLGDICETFDGTTKQSVRTDILRRFSRGETRMLSTVHVLAEGIDLPCANVCIFVEPRHSKIDIVQCVGRVLRKYDSKPFATIVLPTSEERYDLNRVVWALSKYDPRISDEMRDHKYGRIYDLADRKAIIDDAQALQIGFESYTRLEFEALYHENSDWMQKYAILQAYVVDHNKLPIISTEYQNVKIGSWCNKQRTNQKKGKLSEEREAKLNLIPGWKWGEKVTKELKTWDETYAILQAYVVDHNELPKQSTEYQNVKIGSWCRTQRANQKKGKFSEEREAKLNLIPGWGKKVTKELKTWDETYAILQAYVVDHNELPKQSTEYQNVKIGSWCNNQRVNQKKGKLSEEREAKLNLIPGWKWSGEFR